MNFWILSQYFCDWIYLGFQKKIQGDIWVRVSCVNPVQMKDN